MLVEPWITTLVDKRDASAVPFWAARGKKYAAETGDGLPFWAARGKKGKFLQVKFSNKTPKGIKFQELLSAEKNQCPSGPPEVKGFPFLK